MIGPDAGNGMSAKKNYSVTNRYFEEKRPVFVKATKHFNINGRHFSRLSFGDSEARRDAPTWDLAHRIRHVLPANAIFFPDTNFFSRPMGRLVWDALFEKRLAITPMIRQEIQPWLDRPYHNREARDVIAASIDPTRNSQEQLLNFDPRSPLCERIILPSLNADFLNHGYQFYFNLLAIRRLIGLELAAELGLPATLDAMTAELQRRFGERGYLVSHEAFTKGTKQNYLADEQTIVMAALTALCTGHETVILTWDTAIQEQFRKLWYLIARDYVAFCTGEVVSRTMDINQVTQLKNESDRKDPIVPDKVKAFKVPATDFHEWVLPPNPSPVLSICLTIGGELKSGGEIKYLRITPDAFCAEHYIAPFLRQKVENRGKNTSRFGECDCVVSDGGTLPGGAPAIMVSIFTPKIVQSCGMQVSTIDKHAALLTRELVYEHEMNRCVIL
jgi:hypothetical protein